MRNVQSATAAALFMVALAASMAFTMGCGDSGTTTVIQSAPAPETTAEAQTTTVTEKTVTEKAPKPETAPADDAASEPTGEPPDVVGLSLPAAESALKSAGYKADPRNTDTLLGIVVEANYTICKQDDPIGNVVPVLAQKYGC